MTERVVPDLVAGWETMLLAGKHNDREVRSAVRLNKLLAHLQRTGFPVPIRFKNLQMGPASEAVESRARDAVNEGLLHYRELEPDQPEYEPTKVWKLTEDGEDYLNDVIYPALEEHPRSDTYARVFVEELHSVFYRRNPVLIKELHNDLVLDDADEFQQMYREVRTELEGYSQGFNDSWVPEDDLALTTAAASELACIALDEIADRVFNLYDDSTGPHTVVWLSDQLLAQLESFEGRDRLEGDREEELQEEISNILNALEVNCEIYGYFEVPDEEELEQEFAEAERSGPDHLIV